MYTMNNIDIRRATREALAWRGMSYLEAGAALGYDPQALVEGAVGLWKVMTLVGATDKQVYEWGHR